MDEPGCLCSLVDRAAPCLDVGGQRQREVQGMDMERRRIVNRLMVTRGVEQGAHAAGVPGLECRPQLLGQGARAVGESRTLVGARNAQLSSAHAKVGAGQRLDGLAHQSDAALRLGIEPARMIEAEPVDQGARPLGVARTDEAAIAARSAPADAVALDQGHAPALQGEQPGAVQAGEAAADDRDISLDPRRKSGPVGARVSRGGIPACRVGAVAHRSRSSPQYLPALDGPGRLARSRPLSH